MRIISHTLHNLFPSLHTRRWGWVFFLSLSLPLACSDAERLFDNYPVRFVSQNTNTNMVLNAALTGMGEFCTIVNKGNSIEYSNLQNTYSKPLTAREASYGYFQFGRDNGFIVGHTNMIASRFPNQVVCYDITCRNCYEESSVTRSVKLISGGRAQCPVCERTYDLNELGIASSGKSLYRYAVSYSPFQLVIGN